MVPGVPEGPGSPRGPGGSQGSRGPGTGSYLSTMPSIS